MRKLIASAILAASLLLVATPAHALRDCRVRKYPTAAEITALALADCTFAYAIDTDVMYIRANGSWTALSTLTTLAGANGGTFVNSTNNQWALGENSEDFVFDFGTGNQLTLSSSTGVATLLTAMDLSLSGGAGAITLTDTASSIVLPDNDTTALLVGSTGRLNLLTFDTGDDTETVVITGTTTADALHVDVGTSLFDEAVTIGAGAGALTLTNSAASILTIDNDTSALDIGSAGLTTALRYSSEDNKEVFTFGAGKIEGTTSITGVVTLDESDCGKTHFVTAALDGSTISLPATIAGCEYRFVYVGADAGCLVDISPNASDAVHGSCTLAASVLEFNGLDDNDIGLTKATSNTGDTITIIGDGTEGWYVASCAGIWANN